MNFKIMIALVGIAATVGSPSGIAAQDGAALYKAKCSACHGANGEGKPSMKAPALKGTTLDASQIVEHITKGEPASKPPHNRGLTGLTDDQSKAIAEFVKSLK